MANLDESAMVHAIRVHAMSNYDKGEGWDFLVECWTDGDILEEISDCLSLSDALERIGAIVKAHSDYRAEIESTAF